MSWNCGMIHENGLVLNENDIRNLFLLSKSFKKENDLTDEDIKNLDIGELEDYCYDLSMFACFVTVCDINKLVGFNENGDSNYVCVETIEDNCIYVLSLKKDNLLNSYKNYNEIYDEIASAITSILKIDIETIYQNLGENFLKDRIGLATGFFGDR